MPWTYPHHGVLMGLLYGSDESLLRRVIVRCAQRIECAHRSHEVSGLVVSFLPKGGDSENVLRVKLLILLDQVRFLVCLMFFDFFAGRGVAAWGVRARRAVGGA